MKGLVAFGALSLVAAFVACGESRSLHPDGDDDDSDSGDGAGGEGPAGQGPGGEGSGGTTGTAGAAGSIGGRGGVSSGGTAGSGIAGGSGGSSGVGGAGPAGQGGGAGVPCGSYDCTLLPNVRPGAAVECRNGVCFIPEEACEEGFTHCSANLNVGCEANLHTSPTCGDCATSCSGLTPACTLGPNGWRCSQGCEEPTPDKCRNACTNFDTDRNNCGTCGNDCEFHGPGVCEAGVCMRTGPCDPHWGDCTVEPGCETEVNTADDCGACGRNDCGADGATLECSSPSGCVPPTCIAGYANCDRASLDCETRTGACFPTALPAIVVANPNARVAVADGGAVFLFGNFIDTVDFDPTSGSDPHTSAGEADDAITRIEPNGAYGWTRTFGGTLGEDASTVSVGRDGSVLVAGTFQGSVDLDPGPAVDLHTAGESYATFVSKFTATGNLVWARTLPGPGSSSVSKLAGDASGAVYAIGVTFTSRALRSGGARSDYESETFLVKYDAGGSIAWQAPIKCDGYAEWTGLGVAADGSVWAVGRYEAPATLLGRPLGSSDGLVVAGFEATGSVRTLWLPGEPTRNLNHPTLFAGTNVHVSGQFIDVLDMDPGAATVTRTTLHAQGPSGFALSLGSNASYRSVHVFDEEPSVLAETPDGGLLAFRYIQDAHPNSTPNLIAYYEDGAPAWSLRVPHTYYTAGLTASRTHFAYIAAEPFMASGVNGPVEPAVLQRFAF